VHYADLVNAVGDSASGFSFALWLLQRHGRSICPYYARIYAALGGLPSSLLRPRQFGIEDQAAGLDDDCRLTGAASPFT